LHKNKFIGFLGLGSRPGKVRKGSKIKHIASFRYEAASNVSALILIAKNEIDSGGLEPDFLRGRPQVLFGVGMQNRKFHLPNMSLNLKKA